MIKKVTVRDVNLSGHRVLFRADYNVPIVSGTIMDATRIDATYPTLQYLISQNIRSLIILSHLGRPKGKRNDDYSLYPVYKVLKSFLEEHGISLKFCEMYDGKMAENKYVFVENLRFNPGEDDINHADYQKYVDFLNKSGDILVVDAFGVLHRRCTSVMRLSMPVVAGLLVEKELRILQDFFENRPVSIDDRSTHSKDAQTRCINIKNAETLTKKPSQRKYEHKTFDLLLLGGKKVLDKLQFLRKLIPLCKEIFLFGAMCFPFLKIQGLQIGKSYCEEIDDRFINDIIELANISNTRISLPCDFVCRTLDVEADKSDRAIDSSRNNTEKQTILISSSVDIDFQTEQNISYLTPDHNSDPNRNTEKLYMSIFKSGVKAPGPEQIIVDIGSETIKNLKSSINSASTIFCNGTPGIYELDGAHVGTMKLVQLLMNQYPLKRVIIGGGDTAAAVSKFGQKSRFFHVSTGGGALIALMQGESLPGLDAIHDKINQ